MAARGKFFEDLLELLDSKSCGHELSVVLQQSVRALRLAPVYSKIRFAGGLPPEKWSSLK